MRSNPFSRAIFGTRGEVTTVVIITPFSGKRFCWCNAEMIESRINIPIWLPVNQCHCFSLSRTITPRRSASGSLAKIRSSSSVACSTAILKASLSSGLGDPTVLKSPSGTICSLTTFTFSKPCCCNNSGTNRPPVP